MICAIIQARMGSTRLPGKMMRLIQNKTLLELVIKRVKKTEYVDKVILATTSLPDDEILLNQATKYGIDCFIGSPNDVLDRYYQCAKAFQATTVVRITGDCPLIDPVVIDQVIRLYQDKQVDYSSNFHPPTYPNGLDVEVFSFHALEKAWNEAQLPSEREHVTPYIWKHPALFPSANLAYKENLSHIRITIDQEEDLITVNQVVGDKNPEFISLDDISSRIKNDPSLCSPNSHITRNEGYKKSVESD